MKVLKFGGTSVGTPENFKRVMGLINNEERKIIVLSAFSGTTNTLFKISELIQKGKLKKAKIELQEFLLNNKNYISELFSRIEYKNKAIEIVTSYAKLIKALIDKKFTDNMEKTIVCFGEMISTKIMNLALSEKGVSSIWINALDFMKKDETGQLDMNF